jgi:hypothetical protein
VTVVPLFAVLSVPRKGVMSAHAGCRNSKRTFFFTSWQLQMWRSTFIAVGIMAIIIGLECLVIDSANLYSAADTEAGAFVNPVAVPTSNVQQWRPKEWFPWVILSAGGITVLYAITLPKRFNAATAA